MTAFLYLRADAFPREGPWYGVRLLDREDGFEPDGWPTGWCCIGFGRYFGTRDECERVLASVRVRCPTVRYEVQERVPTDAEWRLCLDNRRGLGLDTASA